jgi:hypothetical protein
MASSKALARTTTQPGSRHGAIPAYLPYRYSTSSFAKRATLVELLRQNGQLALGPGRVCARIALPFFPHSAPPLLPAISVGMRAGLPRFNR